MTRRQPIYGHDLRAQLVLPGEAARMWGALLVLLVLGALAVAGPWGVLAWHETAAALDTRKERIAVLEEEIAALENRVELLDPENVDSDLAGELARRNLGVLHADEMVITLPED